jgi:hypothetical protein
VLAHPEMIICVVCDTYARDFHLTDGRKATCFKSMKFYATQLPVDYCLHGHQSYIINLNHARYFWYVDGIIEVRMSNKVIARVIGDLIHLFEAMRQHFPNLKQLDSEYDMPDIE